jgi:hypothetical protein
MAARPNEHMKDLEPHKAKTAEYEKLFEGGVVSLRQMARENPLLGISIGQLINLGAVEVVGTTFQEGHGLDLELVKVEPNHK